MTVTRYADVLAILLDETGTWRHTVVPETVPCEARQYVPDSSWMLKGVPSQPLLRWVRRLNRGYTVGDREFVRELTGRLLAALLQEPPPWNLARVIDEVAVRVAVERVLCAPPLLPYLHQLRELAAQRRTDRLGICCTC